MPTYFIYYTHHNSRNLYRYSHPYNYRSGSPLLTCRNMWLHFDMDWIDMHLEKIKGFKIKALMKHFQYSGDGGTDVKLNVSSSLHLHVPLFSLLKGYSEIIAVITPSIFIKSEIFAFW